MPNKKNSQNFKQIKSNVIFSTDLEKYTNICFFEISFNLTSNIHLNQTYGFHVPILQEEDGLYYALCIEANQVTYGSTTDNAIKRMNELLSLFVKDCLDGNGKWELFLAKPMSNIYLDIFHGLKIQHNKKMARQLDTFLSSDSKNQQIEYEIETVTTNKVKGTLGMATVSQRYDDLLYAS